MAYDEHITRGVAKNIWTGDLRNNWKYADVPLDFKRDLFNFSSYMYADALAAGPHAANPVRRERAFSALLGTLALVFVYFAIAEFFDSSIALITLALCAVFPLLVQDSHYARPEAFVVFLYGVVYWFSARSMRSTRPLIWLAAASFLCGLLIACKVSLIPVAFTPLLCFWRKRRLTAAIAALGAAFVAAGTFAGVPGGFLQPRAFLRGVAFLQQQYSKEHIPHTLIDSRYCYRLLFPYFWQTGGVLFCLLLLGGAAVLLYRRDWFRTALFTVPVVLFTCYFATQRVFFERNLSHAIPLAAALCAAAIVWVARQFPGRYRTALCTLLAVAAMLQPAITSAKLVFGALRISSEERAGSYEAKLRAQEHLPLGAYGDVQNSRLRNDVFYAANHSAGDFILRAHDCNDQYAERGVRIVQGQWNAREIGRFPSLFAGFVPSTLLVYHAPGFRYLRIAAPDSFNDHGREFVNWRMTGEAIQPQTIKASPAFPKGGVLPELCFGMRGEYWGTFVARLPQKRSGILEFDGVPVEGVRAIGIPLITSPTAHALSVQVLDHVNHRVLGDLMPMPVLPLWGIWRIDIPATASNAVDIVAVDNDLDPLESMGIGLPLKVKTNGK